jgi:hypothetical protein
MRDRYRFRLTPEGRRLEALSRPCPRCRAEAGQRCKNYRGQNKAACPERLALDEGKPRQRDLFVE